MSSRLIVRNLAPSVDDKALRAHFVKYGEITDTKIMKTQGKSRCFAFIGFRLDDAAKDAKLSLDRSFIGSTKINVDFAQSRDKNSKNKVLDTKKKPINDKNTQKEAGEQKKKHQDKSENTKDQLKEDFVSSMKKRSSAMSWANDESETFREEAPKRKKNQKSESNDDEFTFTDQISQDNDKDSDQDEIRSENLATNKALSDLNYLKAKSSENKSNQSSIPSEITSSTNDKIKDSRKKKNVIINEKEEDKNIINNELSHQPEPQSELQSAEQETSNRLFVRNLPYSVEENELKTLFNQYGKVSDVVIPVDELKRQKGFAFISYFFNEEANIAKEKLNENIFQGRPLYVSKAIDKERKTNNGEGEGEGGSKGGKEEMNRLKNGTYKQWKELERRKKAMDTNGWNASHVRSDAVVDVISNRLNVNKSDFLDINENNMAVRLAIGETHIISENIKFFENEGIDLSILVPNSSSSSSSSSKPKRSDRILLVKNIPSSTQSQELSQLFSVYGEIERFLLPPSKLVALVEFLDPKDAKKAFKGLAYKRFQNVPLYLEWAPEQAIGSKKNITNSEQNNQQNKNEQNKKQISSFLESIDDSTNNINELTTSLFVKNLSFQTKENNLSDLFSQVGSVRNVFIPKNKSSSSSSSSGYGFVEFNDHISVELALNKFQGYHLQGRSLELKRSHKKLNQKNNIQEEEEEDIDNKKTIGTKTKLLVKNVAFQTSIQEMRELFSTFGTLKSLSMPKKYDGKHRGFAFVDYVLSHEAEEAKKQLSSSHFYGRHLIIDWAKDDNDNNNGDGKTLNEIRNKAKKNINHVNQYNASKRKKQSSNGEEGFDEFMGGTKDDE